MASATDQGSATHIVRRFAELCDRGAATREIYDATWRWVDAVAFGFFKHVDRRAEFVEDMIVALFDHRAQLRNPAFSDAQAAAYARRLIRSRAIDRIRSHGRTTLDLADSYGDDDLEAQPAAGVDLLDALAHEELLVAIAVFERQASASIKRGLRWFELNQEGYTAAQIAARERDDEVTGNAVGSSIRRARTELARFLHDYR